MRFARTVETTSIRGIAHNSQDISGRRYGRLVAQYRAGRIGTSAAWMCACDCGSQKILPTDSLRNGVRSCGCSRRTGKGSRPVYRTKHEPGKSAKRTLLKQYRGAARARGLSWELSDSEFFAITQLRCHYCGVEPSSVKAPSRNGEYRYNGVDRIDNAGGYASANVLPCCAVCNHAKHVMPYDAFVQWLDRVALHRRHQ